MGSGFVEQGKALAGSRGEVAEALFPLGRPSATAQVEPADALDRVAGRAKAESGNGGLPFAMEAGGHFGHGDEKARRGRWERRPGFLKEPNRPIKILAPQSGQTRCEISVHA